jgi:hypothetical protein
MDYATRTQVLGREVLRLPVLFREEEGVKRYHFLLISLAFGTVIGFTNLFAPIHEFYHLAVAGIEGVDAKITSWDTTQLEQFNSKAVFAGWASQLWFGCLAAVIFAIVGRTRPWFTGGAGFGYAAVNWGRGFNSYDFHNTIQDYISRSIPQSQQSRAWEMIHQGITVRWTVMGLIVLGFTLLIVLACLLKKKAGRAPA